MLASRCSSSVSAIYQPAVASCRNSNEPSGSDVMKTILLAVIVLVLHGCATTSTKIEPQKLQELRKGQTTAATVYQQFGRPDFLSRNMDGSQTAFYIHTQKPADATPVIGALSASSETVTFYFDAAGLLSDFKYSPAGATSPTAVTPAAKPSAAAGAATVGAAGAYVNAPAPAATADAAANGKPSAPYLWDILRSSTAKDPRNP